MTVVLPPTFLHHFQFCWHCSSRHKSFHFILFHFRQTRILRVIYLRMRLCCTLEALNIFSLAPFAPTVRASQEQVFNNHRQPKSASFAAKQNTCFHPPLAATLFGPLLKPSSAISAFLISLSSVISLLILFVNHTRKLRGSAGRFASNSTLQHFPTSLAFSCPIVPISLPRFSTRIICQALCHLYVSKIPGSDGIPPIILEMCPWVGSSFTSHLLPFPQAFYPPKHLEADRFPFYS